jgi:hypothetical protein
MEWWMGTEVSYLWSFAQGTQVLMIVGSDGNQPPGARAGTIEDSIEDQQHAMTPPSHHS